MTDSAAALQQKIRTTIPLSGAMQFSIVELSLDSIRVTAPLQPNVNIHGSGFAGSIYSLAVLTGWALCVHIMDELEIDGELVVGKAEIRYRSPIEQDLECRTTASQSERDSFCNSFKTTGRGRMVLEVAVGDVPNAILQATYVAMSRAKSSV